MARRRLQHVSKTGEHSRALESTPEHNELTTRQRISSVLRRKSRAISQLAFWGGAGSTPAASTTLLAPPTRGEGAGLPPALLTETVQLPPAGRDRIPAR